jgi:hypothetical protein
MESTQRTFRHSFGKLALMFIGVLMLAYVTFFIEDENCFFLFMTGLAFIIFLLYTTSRVKISEADITTLRLLGTKSLPWLDISHVSMRGQALRLHSQNDDVVLSIDSQLEGYTEILDIVYSKRSDLFDAGDNNDVMSRSLLGNIAVVGVGLAMMGISSVFVFYLIGEIETFSIIFASIFFAMGIFVIANWFLSPQSILLENQTMLVLYLFREMTYTASEINSITLEKRKTRNGYIYFVQINLKIGKSLKPSGFKLGSALMYQILKRWHEKASTSQQTNSYIHR